jgi:hypothetical protein
MMYFSIYDIPLILLGIGFVVLQLWAYG